MSRHTFTIRLDPALIEALDHIRARERRSRNWIIEQAVRDWIDGPAGRGTPQAAQAQPVPGPVADDTQVNDPGDARGASAGEIGERARRDRPHGPETPRTVGPAKRSRAVPPAHEAPVGPHRHRFTAEVPETRRGIQGVIWATFTCECGKTTELRAPK